MHDLVPGASLLPERHTQDDTVRECQLVMRHAIVFPRTWYNHVN